MSKSKVVISTRDNSRHRLFSTHTPSTASNLTNNPKVSRAKARVDMGGNGDCCPLSIATCITDNILNNPNNNLHLLNQIQDSNKPLLPKAVGLLNPSERLMQLIARSEGMAKFIDDLSVNVRQNAVAYMKENKDTYLGAFVHATQEDTSPEVMSRKKTSFDESIIHATAHFYGIQIIVRVALPGAEGVKTLKYGPKPGINTPDPIEIYYNGGHYIPIVSEKNAQRFKSAAIHNMPSSSLAISLADYATDSEMDDILRWTENEVEQIKESFEENEIRLINFVIDEQLTKEDLMTIYIKSVKPSDSLNGSHYLGTEFGTENFFAMILMKEGLSVADVEALKDNHYDDQVMQCLIRRIAQALALGQITEDAVFEPPVLAQSARANSSRFA